MLFDDDLSVAQHPLESVFPIYQKVSAVELTNEEKSILDGKQGPARQKAMEIVVALGKIYGAENLIPIVSAQISGVSYKNLGDPGLEFLHEWAKQGGQVSVPTTLNPAGMDLEHWQELGFKDDFAKKQLQVIDCFQQFQIPPICSCTPYLIGNLPKLGDHLAWAESSAIAFANSVLGSRTNREGGPSALAAALLGKTANYGLHLDHARLASYLILVQCPLQNEADFGALGYKVGKLVQNSIPYFRGIHHATLPQLKALGAAMAAVGSVALFHIEGLTPEASMKHTLADHYQTIEIQDLQDGYQKLNSTASDIDMVAIGCPHASWEEIQHIAGLLMGKKVKAKFWITTAAPTYYFAQRAGLAKIIENAGAHIVSDTCMIVAPLQDLGIRSIATNSAKAAYYAPSHCGVQVRYGNLRACVDAALSGRFTDAG